MQYKTVYIFKPLTLIAFGGPSPVPVEGRAYSQGSLRSKSGMSETNKFSPLPLRERESPKGRVRGLKEYFIEYMAAERRSR